MNSFYINRNRGFTLIELVISAGIITILSSIIISLFFELIEKAADRAVRISLTKSFKECQVDIITNKSIPRFILDMSIVRRNGFYKFYQQYDYIPRKDGYIPPTVLGNCIGPLGPHRLGVRKIKGKNKNGEIWINLSTGEKIEKGGLTWGSF